MGREATAPSEVHDARSTAARRADRARDDVRLLRDSLGRSAALKVATELVRAVNAP